MLKLHREKFVKTTDDWHPNFPGDKVKIILNLIEMSGGYYDVHVRAWGADDFALTLDKTGLVNFLRSSWPLPRTRKDLRRGSGNSN